MVAPSRGASRPHGRRFAAGCHTSTMESELQVEAMRYCVHGTYDVQGNEARALLCSLFTAGMVKNSFGSALTLVTLSLLGHHPCTRPRWQK